MKIKQLVSESGRENFIKMLWEKLRDNLIMVFVIKSNFLDKDNKTVGDFDRSKVEKITVVSPDDIMTLLGKVPEYNNSNCSKAQKKSNKLQDNAEIRRDAYINEVNINDDIDEPITKFEEKMAKFGNQEKKGDNKTYNFIKSTFSDDNPNNTSIGIANDNAFDGSLTDYKEICPQMKHIPEFDFRQMANVWQIVYYRMPNTLSCFKLNIRNVTFEARQRFADFLGNFNDTVTWERCYLEIQSQGKLLTRRHFLQDAFKKEGLFENIIIDEEIHSSMRKSYVLEKKTVNQWIISNGLLMMRDCDTGDLAVFTKHLTKPSLQDVAPSVKDFGIEDITELKECDEV